MRTVLATLLLIGFCFSATQALVSGVYVQSSDVPDLHDIQAFVADVTQGLATDREKAIALWGAVVELMPQSPGSNEPYFSDSNRIQVDDPIKLWNVYGFGFCSYDSHALQACFRELGWLSRNWELHLHTVNETFYDGAWHVFDAAHERYFPHPVDGHIASKDELKADATLTFCNNYVDYYPGGRVPPTKTPQEEYDMYSYGGEFLGMGGRDEFSYGHFMDITLKRGEVFTRYFAPLGTSSDYWCGQDGGQDGGQAPYWYLSNWDPTPAYANGLIEYSPPFADPRYRQDIEEESNLACTGDDGLTPTVHLASVGVGYVVFRVRSPYIMTSASFSGQFLRSAAGDSVSVYVYPYETRKSTGVDWGAPVWTASGTGTVTATDVSLTSVVRGRYSYLVKIEFSSSGTITDVGVESVTFDTVVMNAPPALPRLAPGSNTIHVTSQPRECVRATPWTITDDVFDQAYRYSNLAHEDTQQWYGMLYPTVDDEWCEVVYKFVTPGDVTDFEFGGRFYLQDGGNDLELAYSWDDSAYTVVRSVHSSSVMSENIYDGLQSAPAGHRELFLRYRMRKDPSGGTYGVRAVEIGMNVFYTPPVPDPDAHVLLTYAWDDGGLQTHSEEIASGDHTYTLDTNPGLTPTRLQPPFTTFNQYVRLELVDGPDQQTPVVAVNAMVVSGTASDDSGTTPQVMVNGSTVPVLSDTFTSEVPVSSGVNSIPVVATDSSSNATTVDLTVVAP